MSIPSTKYGLIFFFFIALIGVWLRALHWVSFPLSYSHLVHAHSHVAFQGWVYVTLFLLLIRSFLADGNLKKYRWQFFATIITVLGILISFAFYGYGLYSITFSTLFQLLNYVFMFCFWKDTRHYLGSSIQWVRVGFAFGVLSSIIPFFIGILSAKGFSGTEIYHAAIFSFLHFQYNGWFLFMIIGLVYKLFEDKWLNFDMRKARKALFFLAAGTLFGVCLSYLGMEFLPKIYPIAILSVIFKAIGLWYLLFSFPKQCLSIFSSKGWSRKYIFIFLGALILKSLLQTISVFPSAIDLFFNNKYLILAYLHLSLIAMISCSLLALMHHYGWIANTFLSRLGNVFLMMGFVVSEVLLVTGGLGMFYSPIIMLIASGSMAFAVLCLILSPIQNKFSLWKCTNGSL
ncbi:hypothetical protein ACI76W_10860 [Capnocytophaga canimorsus]|uniref:hypothetical protein n=1 Tax=Capnocytophaga canimorsus TaxID=28188 RepID=UPI00385AC7C8